MVLISGIFILYGVWILLAFSLLATIVHGGQEVAGWWGKPASPIFVGLQTTFAALAIVGLPHGHNWAVWLLVVSRLLDGIGFHVVWHPEWPGRETLLLPLADAAFLTLWMVA
jgi:hypothetical protein